MDSVAHSRMGGGGEAETRKGYIAQLGEARAKATAMRRITYAWEARDHSMSHV